MNVKIILTMSEVPLGKNRQTDVAVKQTIMDTQPKEGSGLVTLPQHSHSMFEEHFLSTSTIISITSF